MTNLLSQRASELLRKHTDPEIGLTEAAALRAIEAALRLPAGEGWQPIETAPKNGRQLILLLTPSNWPQIAYSNTWWTAGFSVECKPTHWAPIPQPMPAAPRHEPGEG